MKIFFALALVLPAVFFDFRSCNAVRVNGQEMTDDFSYENNESSNIAFKIQDGAIQVGETSLDESQLGQIASSYASLKGQLGQIRSGTTIRFGGNVAWQYLSGPQILFESQPGVSINTCILATQELSLTGNHIELTLCFANSACGVVLKPYDGSNSIVKELKFFSKTTSEPYQFFMQGDVDFANNTTPAVLIVVGAGKVDIKLK